VNVHIHPVSLEHASRILKCLASAGRSGCFRERVFIGAGPQVNYEFDDALGKVQVQLFPRASVPSSSLLKKVVATLAWTRKVKTYVKKMPASCINVHGLSTLAVGVTLKRHHHCRLVYDTHELESKALAIRGARRLYAARLERALIRYCDAVTCVSDGIADWYANEYGIARPLVVRNVPDRRLQDTSQSVVSLRDRCGIPSDALVFLYTGRISTGRQVECFLKVFMRLPSDRHLVFLGRGELQELVRKTSANHANIHFLPAVPPGEVLAYAAQADVGLVGVENRCLSYYLSLPNKLFECLAAGVPVIIPDFPELRRIVDSYGCGWKWSGEANELVALIEELSPDQVNIKRQLAQAAGRELCWEKEETELLRLYHRLLN
jgi:glycosyltransferase involved in cell wall biosynthesis